MSVKPSYDPGDLLKLDYKYLKIRDKEAKRFSRLNKIRKHRGLPRIDIYNDSFIVKTSSFDNHTMILKNGTIIENRINFVSCYLRSEDPGYIDLKDPHLQCKFIYLPSYRWLAADRSNISLVKKELAITRACPYCNEPISISDDNKKIIITCKCDTNSHSLLLKSEPIINNLNTLLDFEVTFKVHNGFRLSTKSYKNGLWLLNEKPLPISESINLITLIERIKKMAAFY